MDVRDQVKHKVACIQDTIASIADVQQQLKTNCLEAKSEIHSSISRQLETLRSREVWLLNQVDIIRHIKEERLQSQLACLLHELGGLQHLIQIAQSCGNSCGDLNQELVETLYRLKDLGDKPLEEADISFHADVNKLRRAVCSFGIVDAVGHTMEEYPMTDSLCNSLSGLTLMGQTASGGMEVEFPPFDAATSLSEWLAERDDADDFVMLEDDPFKIQIPAFDDQPTKSEPLESYFNQVNLSPLAEWLIDSGHFQAEFGVGKSYPYVMKYFREISNDIKDWLLDYEKTHQVDMEDEKEGNAKDCKVDVCHCAGPPDGLAMQAMEIENLDQLLCIQEPVNHYIKEQQPDNKWLRSDENECTPPITLPSVKSSCRANEPCHDFAECVCDTNCAVTAIAQSNPSLDNEQVLSYFQRASKNPADWLNPNTTEYSGENVQVKPFNTLPNHQWLKTDQESTSDQSNYVCEFAYFNSVTDSSDWLRQKSDPPHCPVPFSSPLDVYLQQRSNLLNDWLIKEAPSEMVEEIQEKDSKSKDEENGKWLHCTHSEENQSSGSGWEMVKKYHDQTAHSDWLLLQTQPNAKSEWLLDSSSTSKSSSPCTTNIEAYKLFLHLESTGDESKWLKE